MIYPPLLKSAEAPFILGANNAPDCVITFTVPKTVTYSNIGHIQVTVVSQADNRSIVDISKSPDQVIYISTSSGDITALGDDRYQFTLPLTNIKQKTGSEEYVFQDGGIYKIQIRFGTDILWSEYDPPKTFQNWKTTQLENDAFGEWSTVMLIKTISLASSTPLNVEFAEQTSSPLIQGFYTSNLVSKELEDYYYFKLYKQDTDENNQPLFDNNNNPIFQTTPLEDTGYLVHDSANDISADEVLITTLDSFRPKHQLESGISYKVEYQIITVNGYIPEEPATAEYTPSSPAGEPEIDLEFCVDEENGRLKINYIESSISDASLYVLSRSKNDGSGLFEDILFTSVTPLNTWIRPLTAPGYSKGDKVKHQDKAWISLRDYNLEEPGGTIDGCPVTSWQEFNPGIYTDYTLESGQEYLYGIQEINSATYTRSGRKIFNNATKVDFEYSYLYRDGVQLKLAFNNKISSFKHTTLRNKQDTIGGKYPILLQNGNSYYAEFQISGLISYHDNETFFTIKDDGVYYRDKKILDKREFSDEDNFTITTNPSHFNIKVERLFRQKVEEFLNDFTFKLYKSPTEGNMIVNLMNVSLTPFQGTNRMIYEFTATAYEMAENTTENLINSGILNRTNPQVAFRIIQNQQRSATAPNASQSSAATAFEHKGGYEFISQTEDNGYAHSNDLIASKEYRRQGG